MNAGIRDGGDDAPGRATLRGHVELLRMDYWFKNVFVFPGVVVALGIAPESAKWSLLPRLAVGLACTCLVASSNYVLNEIVDAPFDVHHPKKRSRPVPSGRASVPLGYAQWLLLAVVGIGTAWMAVSVEVAAALGALWIMGCLYNVPPVRTKDVAYLDVLSEAINNPLRMLIGWYIVGTGLLAPASLLASYWMVGCYFMGMKRFAEYRSFGDPARAAAYRKSFGHYTEERLLVSVMFYAASSMLFFGAFLMRYRMELILTFPLVSFVMAQYFAIAFKPDSAAQHPERLYREPKLMIGVSLCAVAMGVLLFVDVPAIHRAFVATPTAR
jgi:decaprenyl-phosphate phosphoribosyltransferase